MPRESDAPSSTPIPRWFLALLGGLALPIAGAALAVYVQLAQLGERVASQQTQLTRVEAALTGAVVELREVSRSSAVQAQTQTAQAQAEQRQEARTDGLETRVRDLERVCLPRR